MEIEKKDAESTTSQDIIEKRPEIDFHFFSDTEVTKYIYMIFVQYNFLLYTQKIIFIHMFDCVFRNQDSRSCSPVQSDTEFEMRKITQEGSEIEDDKSHQQSWRWGELPSPPPEPAHMSHRNSLSSLATTSQSNNS